MHASVENNSCVAKSRVGEVHAYRTLTFIKWQGQYLSRWGWDVHMCIWHRYQYFGCMMRYNWLFETRLWGQPLINRWPRDHNMHAHSFAGTDRRPSRGLSAADADCRPYTARRPILCNPRLIWFLVKWTCRSQHVPQQSPGSNNCFRIF